MRVREGGREGGKGGRLPHCRDWREGVVEEGRQGRCLSVVGMRVREGVGEGTEGGGLGREAEGCVTTEKTAALGQCDTQSRADDRYFRKFSHS